MKSLIVMAASSVGMIVGALLIYESGQWFSRGRAMVRSNSARPHRAGSG